MFCKKGILRNFAKFARNHLCRSVSILIKLQDTFFHRTLIATASGQYYVRYIHCNFQTKINLNINTQERNCEDPKIQDPLFVKIIIHKKRTLIPVTQNFWKFLTGKIFSIKYLIFAWIKTLLKSAYCKKILKWNTENGTFVFIYYFSAYHLLDIWALPSPLG